MAITEPAATKIKVISTAMDGLVEIDDRGIARAGGSRSRIVDIVVDVRFNGLTPEQMIEQYPHLSLAQVHAALAYYHTHRDEFDAKIEREAREAEEIRNAAEETPVIKRLKRLRSEGYVP